MEKLAIHNQKESRNQNPTYGIYTISICIYILYVFLSACNMQQPAETPSPILYKHQKMRDEDLVAPPKRVKLDVAEEGKVKTGAVCRGQWEGGICAWKG